MVLQLAACGSNAASGTENTSDNGATAATETAAASESAESVDTETAATEDTGTHTVVDHAGNTVEVPNHITRVVIDQIPILSTYMSYFGGEAPYIVGYCGSFKDTISKTVLKNIAPELMELGGYRLCTEDLNIEEITKQNRMSSYTMPAIRHTQRSYRRAAFRVSDLQPSVTRQKLIR